VERMKEFEKERILRAYFSSQTTNFRLVELKKKIWNSGFGEFWRV
jgi:hypothetical protein